MSELAQLTDSYRKIEQNKAFLDELAKFEADNNTKLLEKLFLTNIKLGTAGLRGRTGCGFNAMNDVTVSHASLGLAKYVKECNPNKPELSVVIGFDARHYSEYWSRLVSTVFEREKFKVHRFGHTVPTPFVPFSVKKLEADVGIMITASHNPKQDNGYKIYWSNGAQICSPRDQFIARAMESFREEKSIQPIAERKVTVDLKFYKTILQDYLDNIYREYVNVKEMKQPKCTYTAFHGVGAIAVKEMFKKFGYKPFVPVKSQNEPDPEFPTVTFPNPEEGDSVMDEGKKAANESKSVLIYANDPDADRMDCGEKLEDGSWRMFNGNEIGTMLGHFLIKKNAEKKDGKKCVITTVVSSALLKGIAKKYGMQFIQTLTGFKWMGNEADKVLKEKKMETIFAFEEAIGFMCNPAIRDKDGVSAIAYFHQLAMEQYTKDNKPGFISRHLENIYQEFGKSETNNSYYICDDQAVIRTIFNRVRSYPDGLLVTSEDVELRYPAQLANYKIKRIIDLTAGFDVVVKNGTLMSASKPSLPVDKTAQMIIIHFDGDIQLTVRTSGTEPKIKYYSEKITKMTGKSSAKKPFKDIIEEIVEVFLEPKRNNLQARK
ncbi:hypothetical protein SNEBB_000485 [Seison nebaliae]|nr:hypothetical protein SNEBB_000485 [Seison nebaliae]